MFNLIPQQWLIYGVIGLAIVSGFLFLMWRNESLSSENKQLTQQVSTLQAEIAYKDEMNAKITESLNNLKKKKDKRQEATNVIKEQIYKAPPEKDGSVSPVLDDALMLLRNRAAANSKD